MVELRALGQKEKLREITLLNNKLEAIGKEQNLFALLAKTYLFQAHLALLQGDEKRGKALLKQAQTIAQEKGYEKLAAVITKEQQRLDGVLPDWGKEGEKLSLLERMNKLQLEGLVVSLRQNRVEFFTGKPAAKPTLSELLSFTENLKERQISW